MPDADDRLTRFIARLQSNPTAQLRDVAVLRAELAALGERTRDFLPSPGDEVVLHGRRALAFGAELEGPILVYLHGGGFVAGSPWSHHHVCGLLAQATGAAVYAPDYRLAPEAPFPAAVNDAVATCLDLLSRWPDRPLALAGDSAGGGLALVTALALRDRGLTMPACIVALSPWVSHRFDDPAYAAPLGQDPTLSRDSLAWYSSLYAPGHDPSDPALSPLFAELGGLPPVLLQVGGREVLRGDAATLHAALQAAGVSSRLETWPGLFHAWHLFWPWLDEARAAIGVAAAFAREHLSAGFTGVEPARISQGTEMRR